MEILRPFSQRIWTQGLRVGITLFLAALSFWSFHFTGFGYDLVYWLNGFLWSFVAYALYWVVQLALIVALPIGALVGYFKTRRGDEVEYKKIPVNHVGVQKFFGNVNMFKWRSVTDHGDFLEIPFLYLIDKVQLFLDVVDIVMDKITSSNGADVFTQASYTCTTVDPWLAHSIEYGTVKGVKGFLNEEFTAKTRTALNKITVDEFDMTKAGDYFALSMLVTCLASDEFTLPKTPFAEKYLGVSLKASPEEKRRSENKASQWSQVMDAARAVDSGKSYDHENMEEDEEPIETGNPILDSFLRNTQKAITIDLYYSKTGHNVRFNFQKSILADPEVLRKRAEGIVTEAEMKAERIRAKVKIEIQGLIREKLREIYKDTGAVSDEMILKTALLITNEFKEEKLFDFGGLSGLGDLISEAKNFVNGLRSNN